MARSWTDAKARIATLLAAVSITSPVAQTIKKVYSNPPGAVQDVPCFIIYPPAVPRNERPSGSLRTQEYVVRLRLLALDADLERAAALCDAYRSIVLGEGAALGTFDADVTLNATCVAILGPTAEEAASFQYGAKSYTGIDFLLTLRFSEAIEHQA